MTNRFYVYAYRDPTRNLEYIYVGKGQKQRHLDHLNRTDKHPFVQRLQKMKRSGVEPVIEFLCMDVNEELAFLVEEEAILKFGRKDLKTGTLLNLTAGGEGVSSWIATPEYCAKMSAHTKSLWDDPEFRAKMIAQRNDPEYKKMMADVRTREFKQQISDRVSAQWQDPEFKANMVEKQKAVWKDPAYAEKHSSRHKKLWDDPAWRAATIAKMQGTRSKKCTVDGVTIYPSRKALKAALGSKNGVNSPHFRYV